MSQTDGDNPRPWPLWKISLVLYPFAGGAGAINVFFLGLLGQSVSLVALGPTTSVLIGLILGVPLAWIAGLWVQRLIARAEGRDLPSAARHTSNES